VTATTLRIAPVAVAAGGLRHEARAAAVVWRREILRFRTDRGRLVSSMVQPVLFLFVLGKGLGSTLSGRSGGLDYSTFLFPGTITTGVMFTAVFSAISIVWDREVGFLREMMVAPVSRSSIVVGKCFGGATIATLQGVVLLALAGLVGVPYAPALLLGCLGLLFLTAFAITAFGLVLAVNVEQVQAVMPRVQLLLMPLMFLSGSLFPVTARLPVWLEVLTKANPMTYAVDAMRRLVLSFVHGGAASGPLRTTVTWGGWVVPVWLEVLLVTGVGTALLGVACAMFSRTE
jgi:ABC-2 type transport system permease protein